MKKLIAVLLILIVGITSLAAFDVEAYGGVGTEMYNADGFVNTMLSDERHYTGDSIARLRLNLASMNGFGSLITVNLGARSEVLPYIYALAELKIGFIDGFSTYAINGEVGALAFFPAALLIPNLHVGIGLKTGYFDFTKNLGRAAVMGRAPVIIQKNGTKRIDDNYLLDFTSSGISITPFADITLDLSSSLAIGVDVGYQFAIALKHELVARASKDVKIEDALKISPKDYSEYYYDLETYQTNGTYVRERDLDPKVSLTGLTVNAYVMIRY